MDLIVDRSRSGPTDDVPAAVIQQLTAEQKLEANLTIFAVNGAGANPVTVQTVALDPDPGKTARIAVNARSLLIGCVPRWISSSSVVPTRPGSDILGAVNEAIRHSPAQIIVMSDGLNNTDPLDLNAIGYAADPADVVASLKTTNSIEHAKTSTPVLWADLGVTVTPLPGAVHASLHALWTAILSSANLKVTFSPDQTPAGRPSSSEPNDPLTVPHVGTSTLPHCTTAITVPSDLLFQPGDAHLQPGATAALAGAVTAMTKDPKATAIVSGHTAAYGSTSYRHNLSVERATAVVNAIEASGISASRLTAVGYGSTQPTANEFPDGVHDLAAAAKNRRVVIDIKASGCVN